MIFIQVGNMCHNTVKADYCVLKLDNQWTQRLLFFELVAPEFKISAGKAKYARGRHEVARLKKKGYTELHFVSFTETFDDLFCRLDMLRENKKEVCN